MSTGTGAKDRSLMWRVRAVGRRVSLGGTSILIALVALMVLLSIFSPRFLSAYNLQITSIQVAIFGILAIGQTLVIITAGIDLSVGSMVALAGVLVGLLINHGVPVPFAIVLVLLAGVLVGLFHSFAVLRMSISPLIVTLGTLSILRGAGLQLTHGYPIIDLPNGFLFLGQGQVLGVPMPFIVALVVIVVVWFVLNQTPVGRYVYAAGGNFRAARAAGVNTGAIITLVYVASAFLAALTGIILTSFMGSGQPGAANGWELQAIAASVIGGASLFGGVGTVSGAVFGAAFIMVLANGMVLLNVSPFLQQIVTGSLILLAVSVDFLRRRTRANA